MNRNESMVGKRVKFVDANMHFVEPKFFPAVGTIGTVVRDGQGCITVEWAKGSTSEDDVWSCGHNSVEIVEVEDENTNMPYDEIWEMLEPKMEKNGFKTKMSYCKTNPTVTNSFEMKMVKTYDEEDVQKAVALAYKIGYMRAMKGRPFKYRDSKVNVTIDNLDEVEGDECPCAPCWAKPVTKKRVVKSHWEKVDPNNPPKIGSKVRYARPDGEKHLKPICIGKEGRFDRNRSTFTLGLRDENNFWYHFGIHLDCLDVWIEGEGDAE